MHIIRLRGPWRYEVLERLAGDATLSDLGKQQLPADWANTLGDDFRGTVRFRRTFHEPTGLEEGQEVWLSIAAVTSTAEVKLNGDQLHACGPFATGDSPVWRHPIRELLSPTSELIIDVSHPIEATGAGGLTGLVQLEIQTVRPRPTD